ncbi:MAG: Uncharacterised protein [Synechococcus sp. MIT S9220]|nr:MAG: Uncharacterised protein [Synechococcus sp. MIT S9220]
MREQSIEDRAERFVLLPQTHHFLDLGQDLPLPKHQAVKTGGNPHQMTNGILVVEGEQVGFQIAGIQSGMSAQKLPDSRNSQFRVANQGINLKTITGAENRSLKHLVMTPQILQGFLHGLLRNTELFAHFDRCRSMTEADNGDVHGENPRC